MNSNDTKSAAKTTSVSPNAQEEIKQNALPTDKSLPSSVTEKQHIQRRVDENRSIENQLPSIFSQQNEDHAKDIIEALSQANVPPEQIVNGTIELLKTQATIEANKKNRWLKPITLTLSTGFMLLPLIPSISLVAAYAIASVGAVGFGTILYDIYGAHALEAGKSFRNFFRIGDKENGK